MRDSRGFVFCSYAHTLFSLIKFTNTKTKQNTIKLYRKKETEQGSVNDVTSYYITLINTVMNMIDSE